MTFSRILPLPLRFIRGLRTDLEIEVTLSTPHTLDEACHKALEVEKLDEFYPMRRAAPSSRDPTQSIPKINKPSVSASLSKGHIHLEYP